MEPARAEQLDEEVHFWVAPLPVSTWQPISPSESPAPAPASLACASVTVASLVWALPPLPPSSKLSLAAPAVRRSTPRSSAVSGTLMARYDELLSVK